MKGSTWTWLRDKCIELGYTESAKLAQEIEDVPYRLYGTSKTEAWAETTEERVDVYFYMDPFNIIACTAFCYACGVTGRSCTSCSECEFGKETGICGQKDSLYLTFCEMLEKEQSKK